MQPPAAKQREQQEVAENFDARKACSKTCNSFHKFSGVSMDELLIIEVCAGSARLTKNRSQTWPSRASNRQKCGTELWH